ncbi:hypothetical protein CCACVL1_14336 [Corchorus capsularis]|uniref:Uncharacterized protein n=1 Tax=Corchorus capsularis TaxID=210143 RepID=A0A1R3I7I3_COCAP|nr:hypothetical protein CCACVL1_14336 [Corchorus capsularis]
MGYLFLDQNALSTLISSGKILRTLHAIGAMKFIVFLRSSSLLAEAQDSSGSVKKGSTVALDNIIRQLARSSSSLEGQLELKLLPTLALNDRFLFDQPPQPLLVTPSSPSEPGEETRDSASSELHLPCSRNDFQDKNSLPQFSQTLQLFNRLGFVLKAIIVVNVPAFVTNSMSPHMSTKRSATPKSFLANFTEVFEVI